MVIGPAPAAAVEWAAAAVIRGDGCYRYFLSRAPRWGLSKINCQSDGNSQAPPLDGRVELPKQQVTENRWTTSD